MPPLEIADLKDRSQFQLLLELDHQDLAPFIADYYSRDTSWITVIHHLVSFAILCAWFYTGYQGGYSLGEWIAKAGAILLTFAVLLLVHEWIHGAVYKAAGAEDVRYHVSLRQFYAYAIAPNFVANRLVFTWVAIAPFVVISTVLMLAVALCVPYRFYLLGVLLLHTAATSGDCAMLNYLWLNRRQDIYTFDDATEKRSYFYARVER
jgi:hypothetical protein